MALVSISCHQCGEPTLKSSGHVNRSRKIGAPLFCSKACFGLSHRKGKTKAQKVAEKREYDQQYRQKNLEMLKAKKAEYFQRTYDPVKAAEHRQTRMPYHVEYCRRPEYRAWKRDYDRQYRAEQEYGEFAECFLLVMDIRNECLSQMTDYEIRYAKGGIAKTQQRKRAYGRSLREDLENCPVGNLELGQGWQDGGRASGLRRLPGSRNSANDEHTAPRGTTVQAPRRGGSHHVRRNVSTSNQSRAGGA